MTKRNILAEADKFLVKGEVTELPLTMDTLRKIAARYSQDKGHLPHVRTARL